MHGSFVTAWLVKDENFRIKDKIIDNFEWCVREKRRLQAKGIECEIVTVGKKVAVRKVKK